MTAPKPPDNKTLVGLPNELKAILERPRTSPPRLPHTVTQPAAAAQHPVQPRREAVAREAVAREALAIGKGSMDRTLIGIPSEMQAALERALAEQAAGKVRPARPRPAPRPQPTASEQQEVPPAASSPVLRVQAVRTIGVSNARASEPQPEVAPTKRRPEAPRTQQATPARRSVPPQQLPQRPAPRSEPPQQLPQQSARRSAPPQLPTPSQAKPRAQLQLTAQSELLAQSQITSQPFLAPNAPLDWPPAQRRSDSGFMPRIDDADLDGTSANPAVNPAANPAANPAQSRATSQAPRDLRSRPIAAEPSVIVASHEQEPPLDLFAHELAGAQRDRDEVAAAAPPKRRAFVLPPGSGHAKTKRTKAVVDVSPKRWPAILVIALAVIAFGCVVVLRAPNLLPGPLAARLAPAATHGPGERGEAPATATTAAAAAVVSKPSASDTSAASDPRLAPPSPTRPPASPPFTSGLSAQLERKAIERLSANDYPAAKQLYDRLRSAEPNRPEFGTMVELLTRATGPACGQPGQPACTGAVP